MIRTLILALALAGCIASEVPAESPAEVAPALAQSRWLIVIIDGVAPAPSASGERDAASITFGDRSYAASAGCNALGGLFVERESRLYAYPGPQTAMGCVGLLERQETALNAVLGSAPVIARDGDRLVLTGGGHGISLQAAELKSAVINPPEAWQGSALAGQTFEFRIIDGEWRTTLPLPTLAFSDRQVTLTNVCPQGMVGSFTDDEGAIALTFPDACAGAAPFIGRKTAISGPNGELLLAGGGHWLAGDNLRQDRPK